MQQFHQKNDLKYLYQIKANFKKKQIIKCSKFYFKKYIYGKWVCLFQFKGNRHNYKIWLQNCIHYFRINLYSKFSKSPYVQIKLKIMYDRINQLISKMFSPTLSKAFHQHINISQSWLSCKRNMNIYIFILS